MSEELFSPEEFALDEGEVDPMNPVGDEEEEESDDDAEETSDDTDAL